jgi:hypothetical protein
VKNTERVLRDKIKVKSNGQECPFHLGSAACAAVDFRKALTARLEAAPFQSFAACGTTELHALPGPRGMRTGAAWQVKGKGNGQECPFPHELGG